MKEHVAEILECNPSTFNTSVSNFSSLLQDSSLFQTKAKKRNKSSLPEQVWLQYQESPISIESAEQKLVAHFSKTIPNLKDFFSERRLQDIYVQADKRYESIIERVYRRAVKELFIEYYFLKADEEPTLEIIEARNLRLELSQLLDPTSISQRLKDDLTSFYEDMRKVRVLNEMYECWYDKNKKFYKELYNNYRSHLETNPDHKTMLSKSDFRKFYKEDAAERACQFCEISESQISILRREGEIHTKRFYSRGKTMEVDQLRPYGGYQEDNITRCCYWCNNAKTDEFSPEEYKKYIGMGMKALWQERLSRISLKGANK